MTKWRDATLGDVIELKRGYDLPKRARADGPFPIVSSSGISGRHAEAKVQGPGVVTGRCGTLGQVFYVLSDFWPLNTSLYVRDFKGNNERFVALLLQSMDLAQHDGAAAVPGLNRNQLHTVPVRIPDRYIQDRIASIVESVDDLIENNRQRVEVLEEMARAIYREWFVHFRYPGHESVPLVDSPLGPIPDGWAVTKLGSVADLRGGSALTKKDYIRAGYTAFSASGPDGHLADFEIDAKGVVLSAVGARCGRTFRASGRWSSIANTIKILPTPGSCSPAWLALTLEDPSIFPKRGSAQPFVSINDARGIALVAPDAIVMEAFEQTAGAMFDLVDAFRFAADHLASLRDLLLPKLVTGQIDVSSLDLDSLVEGSVG